jgi:hypothetical protein
MDSAEEMLSESLITPVPDVSEMGPVSEEKGLAWLLQQRFGEVGNPTHQSARYMAYRCLSLLPIPD